jgi:hypothetical protein
MHEDKIEINKLKKKKKSNKPKDRVLKIYLCTNSSPVIQQHQI